MARRILAFLFVAAVLPLFAADVSFEGHTVSVSGHASLLVPPDAAIISFTLEVREPVMANIARKANDLAAELSGELSKAGVQSPLVQDGSADIYSELNWESQRLEYVLSLRLRCVLEDLSRLDKVLKVLESPPSKGPGMKISYYGINYTCKDPTAYLARLREKAMNDAGTKAEKAAASHGLKLGKLLDWSDSDPTAGYMWGTYGEWDFSAEDAGGKNPLPRVTLGYDVQVIYETLPEL